MAEITPAEIEPFLWQLWEAKGTDLLFTVGIPPMLRVDGEMRPAEGSASVGYMLVMQSTFTGEPGL